MIQLPSEPDEIANTPLEAIPALIGRALLSILALASRQLPVSAPAPAPPQYKTAEEMARILKRRQDRVYELARTGRIPYIPMGKRSMLFDLEEVRQALSKWSRRKPP